MRLICLLSFLLWPLSCRAETFVCQVFYTPSRTIQQRTWAFEHDGAQLQKVWIDGVATHAFSLTEAGVMTSQDNERIELIFLPGAARWLSDFKGHAQGEGDCVATSEQ
jgi:hypothetical protein